MLLRETMLTDVDYQTTMAFEGYGRAELTRRARLEEQQQQQRCQQSGRGSGRNKRKRGSAPTRAGADAGEESDNVLDQMEEEEKRTLATKRKRGAKGSTTASNCDSSGMLAWWYGALRCDHNSVLLSLIAHTKQAARNAACQTLEKQTEGVEGVSDNMVIRGISEQNAVNSAQALVSFVGRRKQDIPVVLAWRWKGVEYRGMTRTINEGRATALHACYMATTELQPHDSTRLRIAWSVASMKLSPSDEEYANLPAVLERLSDVQRQAECGKRGGFVASRITDMLLGEAEPPRTTHLSGVTRSTISCAIRLTVTESQRQSGEALGDELHRVHERRDPSLQQPSSSSSWITSLSQDDGFRLEPLCSPAARIALLITINEELRTWMFNKTRKGNPVKKQLGYITPAEKTREAPLIVNSEPPPLLTLVDFNLSITRTGSLWLKEEPPLGVIPPKDIHDVPFGLGLHVCGDGVVRLPEMLTALRSGVSEEDFAWLARSLIWGAASQASYIANVGSVISAGFANSAISSSKKISVADNHRLLLLSPFDVYSAGLTNLEPILTNTPYSGVYGCRFDHGVSPPGHLAHNYCSDERQHGTHTRTHARRSLFCFATHVRSLMHRQHDAERRDGRRAVRGLCKVALGQVQRRQALL